MAEVYPSDNDLLNITGDSETGVEYIPTGTAPYYIHFRKLLYRLLLAARRGNCNASVGIGHFLNLS